LAKLGPAMVRKMPRGAPRRRVGLVGAVLALGVVLAGCGLAAPLLPAALPVGAPRGDVAVRVVRGSDHAALLVARVRINGSGPYPFLVDTGAAVSAVNAPLARALHLPVVRRQAGQLQGAGCTSPSGTDRITRWRVGSLVLPPLDVATVELSGSVSDSAVQGLLGSDLWDRFSSLEISYARGLVRVGAVSPGTSVPVRVVHQDTQVLVVAPVEVSGHGPYPFVVDTGAAESVVSQQLASSLHLRRLHRSVTVHAVGCRSKATAVSVAHWSSGPVSLPAGLALALRQPLGAGAPADVGILGSDELSRFADVTVDYADQRLILDR
jgi:hypothetical protein